MYLTSKYMYITNFHKLLPTKKSRNNLSVAKFEMDLLCLVYLITIMNGFFLYEHYPLAKQHYHNQN